MILARVRLLVWKELLQLRRDVMLLRMLIIMPIAQLFLLGYVVSADVTDIRLAVVDLDHSSVSRTLDSAFEASGYFQITQRPASEAELEPLLDDGQVVLGVVIPHGTAAGVAAGRQAPVAVVVDGTNAQISTTASNYAVQIIQTFNSQLASQNGASLAYPRIDARVRVVANPTLAVVNAMIPGLIALIMMMTLMIIMSMAVVREREAGTLEQMFTTPIRPGEYLAGKVAPYAVIAVAQSAIVGVLGTWWFGVPFAGNIWVLATGLALFLLVAIGLGLLISLVSSNRQQAIQTCVFTLIPFIVLSGWVFPIESMPEAFQPVTQAIPLAHMIEILRSTFMKQSGFADMAYPLLMLAGMAVVFFSSAVAATHYRLREA